ALLLLRRLALLPEECPVLPEDRRRRGRGHGAVQLRVVSRPLPGDTDLRLPRRPALLGAQRGRGHRDAAGALISAVRADPVDGPPRRGQEPAGGSTSTRSHKLLKSLIRRRGFLT